MDSLKDVLTFLRMWLRVKRAPLLSVGRGTRLLRCRNSRRPLPLPPYRRGPMGGYLVPFKVAEPKRGLEWVVWIEMFAPTLLRAYWLPCELELTLTQVAAMSKLSPSRIYGRLRTPDAFISAEKRGVKWVFRRDDFLRYDLPALDPDCDRQLTPDEAAKPTPGFHAHQHQDTVPSSSSADQRRGGRHIPGCPGGHRGPCRGIRRGRKPRQPRARNPRTTPRWTKDLHTTRPRPAHVARPRARADESTDAQCLPDRPTTVELRLWKLAGHDPAKYLSLAEEYSDEIAEARAAGLFAPKLPKR